MRGTLLGPAAPSTDHLLPLVNAAQTAAVPAFGVEPVAPHLGQTAQEALTVHAPTRKRT